MMRKLLLVAALGILAPYARGDGKFFVREKVPADVPYQRAFLLFYGGQETLIVQSKYELPQSAAVGSLGWVMPAPTVPEIASADARTAAHCFLVASMQTQPHVYRVSDLFSVACVLLFLGGVAFLLVCLVQYPFACGTEASKAAWGRRARNGVMVTVLAFLLAGMTLPGLSLARVGAAGVEIVKAQKAGIYDVKVIRGDSAGAIMEWLKENAFAFNNADIRVFADYVERGWCFVTAKVEPDPEARAKEISAEGMVAPLILKFASDRPIYPLALTATAASKTEVLIYTFSQSKLACGERLGLRCARQVKDWAVLQSLLTQAELEKWPIFDGLPEAPVTLCKFKGRLTAAQMKQDLEFHPAPDNEPYRQRKIVW